MGEHQRNTSEQNTIVDELKMDEDENIKEISIEDDILGAQSLLISESEDDSINKTYISPQNKISTKKSKRILDSDDESNAENQRLVDREEEEPTKINNNLAIIDSGSDQEAEPINKLEVSNSKLSRLDLDAETQDKQKLGKTRDLQQKYTDAKNSNLQEKSKSIKNKSKKSKIQNNTVTDENKIEIAKEKKRTFSLVDSESSSEESTTELLASDLEASAKEANLEENYILKEKNKSKVIRVSAKKALDEIQAIQSEQQRLHREALISIPYHKPKKHTLDEFLNRRSIIKPQKASPVSTAVQSRRLKMSTEELEEYAKLMEERAKEATEFFKSESENDEEEVFKDNEGILDKPDKINELNEENTLTESLVLPNKFCNEEDKLENFGGVQLTEEELAELLAEEIQADKAEVKTVNEERPTCSKVLITEVIELPKLDFNTVRISPDKKQTSRSSLNVKQLLSEKYLSEIPSLSGDSSKLIDLETGDLIEKKPTGIENLMKRLMSTVKAKKSKSLESCSILSVENGKIELSRVNVSATEAKDLQKEPKPGAAYFKLKKNLKEIIKKKRLEEINKKQEDELEYSKCLAEDDDDNEEEVDIYCNEESETEMENEIYELENKAKSNDVVIDEKENDLVEEDVEEGKIDGLNEIVVDVNSAEKGTDDDSYDDEDDKDNDEDVDDDADADDDDIEDEDKTKTVEKSQRKSRIIKVFDDSDEEGVNDDIDFLKTQPLATQLPLFDTQQFIKSSLEDKENKLMPLCSGTFDAIQKTSVSALMSQIPMTQNNGKIADDEELIGLCSGTFDQQAETQQTRPTNTAIEALNTKCNKILSSDEEIHDENRNEENKARLKKLSKKLKKKKPKLGFSDDEEDENEEYYQEDFDEKIVLEVSAEEEPETFVDYDSEENEILVQMTKKDKVKQAENFFEKEAELSDSEWGSADEDEKNLDKYDVELGDEDEFDREKLQTELGRIHARKMLDEDIREVRKIQEMLFEDEEKDGVGRQRTFKWKNAESGFSLDDRLPYDETTVGQNGDSGDELNEHQWRKIRYEREQFLKEQGLKPDSQDISTVLSNTIKPSVNSTTEISKKIQIITSKKTSVLSFNAKNATSFLISKGKSTIHKKSVRGSFLVRDEETLNKLAGLTKGTSSIAASDADDTAGTVSIKSIKPKNFVFATLTEEEHENLKRKADDLLNSSCENGKNFMKKPKTEPRRDKCFIDQLL